MPTPRHAALPLALLIAGYPLWWALGLGGFAVIPFAVPMAIILIRRRPIRVPQGFGLWLLLLGCYLISAAMLTENPPGTYGEAGAGRFLGYGVRLLIYVSLLIIVLYIGNLRIPAITIVRLLGVLFIATVAGGLLGVLAPRLEFRSPVEMILPGWLADHSFVNNLIHPETAQVHWVLGYSSPRPEAPFEWANAWGSNFSILLIWFVVGWLVYSPGKARRIAAAGILVIAVVPVVYSLNRGLWIGLGLAAVYLVVRLARRRIIVVGAAALAGCVAAVLILSPLGAMVAQRLGGPGSNDIRGFTASRTVEAALHSPFIGYGSTRNAHGNYRSITTGKTSWCPDCGHPPLGSDGQLWLLLISQGFIGAALYVAFFVGAALRYRRDRSPIAMAGTLTMLLPLFYMFVYDAFITPLCLYLISFGVLWSNDERCRSQDGVPAGDAAPALATH